MITYIELKRHRRKFLALTGLTPEEFQRLLPAFTRSYERRFPRDQTLTGRPRRRAAGGGRKSSLEHPEEQLLFLLVYLKTYALQVVLGELFDLSQPRANQWIHRLLPVLRDALDELGYLPERTPGHFAQSQTCPGEPLFIIDATERRRQRPKDPEKQALFYSGKKKTHTAKNVVVVPLASQRVEFLSRTYAGKTHEKKIADRKGLVYPPDTVLYKDTGFQGYEPLVKRTCQPKKKDTHQGAHRGREAEQSQTGEHPRPRRTCPRWREALPHREGCVPKY